MACNKISLLRKAEGILVFGVVYFILVNSINPITVETAFSHYMVVPNIKILGEINLMTHKYEVSSQAKCVVDCHRLATCKSAIVELEEDILYCALSSTMIKFRFETGSSASIMTDDLTEQYHRFGDKIFWVHSMRLNWTEAQAVCRTKGGHLADVESAKEQAFIASLDGGGKEWLGGTDAAQEGTWVWQPSGAPFTYTNWNPGEPNNYNGRPQNCLSTLHDATWYDYECNLERTPICEFP